MTQKCYVLMRESQWRPMSGPAPKADALRVFIHKKDAKNAADLLNAKARDYWYSIKTLPFSV